jgi:hypothetical protein
MTSHPQRCETCEYISKKGSCMFLTRYLSRIAKPEEFENGEGYYVNQSERDLIACIGCASHSSSALGEERVV